MRCTTSSGVIEKNKSAGGGQKWLSCWGMFLLLSKNQSPPWWSATDLLRWAAGDTSHDALPNLTVDGTSDADGVIEAHSAESERDICWLLHVFWGEMPVVADGETCCLRMRNPARLLLFTVESWTIAHSWQESIVDYDQNQCCWCRGKRRMLICSLVGMDSASRCLWSHEQRRKHVVT
jgi:hypothetical protein